MNKTDLLLQMMEQPLRYTADQWQEILADDECRELYTLMSKTQSAVDAARADEEVTDDIIDAEWQQFRSEKIEMKGVKITEKKDCPFTSVNACDYTSASDGAKIIQMLGHSMKAVALPKDGSLTYRFDMKEDGEYMLQTALIPTQPNDNGDLRYSVSIDGQESIVFNLKEPFRSEEWKQNVLRGQALRQQKVSLSKGNHTLTIRALDAHIVVDQWSVQ